MQAKPDHESLIWRLLRWLKSGFKWLAYAVLVYLVIVLVGLIPVNNDFVPTEGGVKLYLVSNAVHTDVIVPKSNQVIDWEEEFADWPQLISYDPDLGCAELMRKRIDRYSRRGFRLCFFERPAERTEAVWARKILDLSPPLKPVRGYEKSTRFALRSPSIRWVFLRQIRDLFRTVSLHRRTGTK